MYYRLNISYDSKTMHLWSKHSSIDENNGETAASLSNKNSQNKQRSSVIKMIDILK